MFKKLLVSTVIAAPMSPVLAYQPEIGSIDELRDLCVSLEKNEQVRMFNKGVLCRSSQSIWQKKTHQLELSNKARVDAATSYEKSDSPKATVGDSSGLVVVADLAQCNVYEQYEVVAPQVPVFVNSCEELTSENVERLCQEAVTDQCFAPTSANVDSVDGTALRNQGACTSTKIAEFNTCDLYHDSGCKNHADSDNKNKPAPFNDDLPSITSSASVLSSMSLK